MCCECVRCIFGVGCDLASTLFKYEMNGDLSVLSWASVRRECQGSVSSELLI